jgi:heat shock protein HslJ
MSARSRRPIAGALARVLAFVLALVVPVAAAAQPHALAGSAWGLVALDGEPVPEDLDVFLEFREEGRVAGRGGCNRFTGGYVRQGGTIGFTPLASTRMACPGPAMAVESAFLAALEAAGSIIESEPDTLVLGDGSGAQRLRFQRRERD